MKPEEMFEKACSDIAEKVDSWEDLYRYFDELAERVRQTQSMMSVLHAFFSMYAFIVAMRDLPDEGDARKLITQMLRNILIDSKEKLGFEVIAMTSDEASAMAEQRLKEMIAAVEKVVTAIAEAPGDEPGQGSQQKRTLH